MARKHGTFYLWKYIAFHFPFTTIAMVSMDFFIPVSEWGIGSYVSENRNQENWMFQYQYYQQHVGHISLIFIHVVLEDQAILVQICDS